MAPKLPIYLDHHATTPCDPRVVEAMLPTFRQTFGNASSRQHGFGWAAEALVDQARAQVASLLGADPTEIVFTSGATESDNLALKGVARAYASKGKHIVTSAIEHKAVLDTAGRLEQEGFEITRLPVTAEGLVEVERVAGAIRSDTVMVSIMAANNEIGTINPIEKIGALCKEHGVLFHTDAVQALPYLDCRAKKTQADLVSVSAHKMYGPKGVGALYVRRRNPRARLEPILDGGGHERGFRSGTLNVTGIVGLGKACELVESERDEDGRRVEKLRDRLKQGLLERVDFARINGSMEKRLPNNLNLSFPGVNGDGLLAAIQNVAVSSGSACTSASLEPSYVLRELGVTEDVASTSIRFGLGRWTTEEEIDFAIEATARAVLAQERRGKGERLAG